LKGDNMKFRELLSRIDNYKNVKLYIEDILSPYIRYDILSDIYIKFNNNGNIELCFEQKVDIFGDKLFSQKLNILLIPNVSVKNMLNIIEIINNSKSKNIQTLKNIIMKK